MSAEYIMAGGNEQVILCERGIRTFADYTRNTLDLSAVPVLHELSHLPVIVDPSHATGLSRLVPSMAMAGVAAGADGLAIETMMDLVVNPLRREMESLRSKMDRLTHAIEKIPSCPHSDNCPVSRELQRNADPEPREPLPPRGKGGGRRNRKDPGGPDVHPGRDKDPGDDFVPED